jgi:hypothetical protein
VWPPKKHTRISWLPQVWLSILVGIAFFAGDVFLGHLHNPNLPPLQAALQSPGPLGIAATLAICPGYTLIALVAWARDRLRSRSE